MSTYYECHITMKGDPEAIKPLVLANKWKFSAIDGDPVLGKGLKCYATTFFHSRYRPDTVLANLKLVAMNLQVAGVKVLRTKIEHVIYDDRSDKVKLCDGDECAACQEGRAH